jgi:hypothetical protein
MTIAAQPQLGADIWTKGGPWRFTRESLIEGAAAEQLYALYAETFDPLKIQAAARQVLTREEFYGQMADHRIDKYVAWETSHGEPIGIITLTRWLDSVPWVSPEYYAARFPEQWARNAVYYLGFGLGRRSTSEARFLETCAALCIAPLVAERAVIAYDVCSYNNDVLGLADRLAQVARRVNGSIVQNLDAQVYYAVNFA